MSPRPLVFISAVSAELKSARQLVANTLMFLGYEPVWQEIFGTEGGDLREILREQIDECKGLVQLVGKCYGAEPPAPDEKFGRVSYTQYEALYARERGKKIWYLFIGEDFPADPCNDESPEWRELQAAYRRRVQADTHLFYALTSREALEMSVLKLRDDLVRLRRGVKQWAAAVAILLVISVGLGAWLLRGQRQTARAVGETKQAMAAMTAELAKLRQGIAEYPHVDAQVRQAKPGEDSANLQEKVYAELSKQLGVDPKLLREKLPQFAEQLKRAPDASGFERANAAFVAKDYGEAERLALQTADEAQKAPSAKMDDAIRALQLACWSAQRRVHYPNALQHLRDAEKLTDRQRDPKTWANVQHGIAILLLQQGNYADAENVWRKAIETRIETLGPEDPDTLRSRMGLAAAMDARGKHKDAEAENRDIIKVNEKLHGADDPDTLAARNNLAEVLGKEGKYAEAETEYRDVIKREEKVLGPEDPDTLRSRNNLSIVLSNEGKVKEAETECRDVIKLKEKVFGPEHPATLDSRNNLASALYVQRHYPEAEAEYRDVVKLEEKALGPEHPNTLMSRNNLALTLASQRKYLDAEMEFRKVAESEEKVLGPEHPDTLRSWFSLAVTLSREGKVAEGKEIAARVVDGARKVWGPDHPLTRAAEKLRDDLQAKAQ